MPIDQLAGYYCPQCGEKTTFKYNTSIPCTFGTIEEKHSLYSCNSCEYLVLEEYLKLYTKGRQHNEQLPE